MDSRGASPHDQPGAGEVELLDPHGQVPAARDDGGDGDAPGTAPPGEAGPAARLVRASRPAGRQLALLAAYVAAGIALTWPRTAYLPRQVPEVRDITQYIWDFWWMPIRSATWEIRGSPAAWPHPPGRSSASTP